MRTHSFDILIRPFEGLQRVAALANEPDCLGVLGFPFARLVPSYATALGASGDRPVALARLMGVILGDGVARPSLQIDKLVFGAGTPYHTALEPAYTDPRVRSGDRA